MRAHSCLVAFACLTAVFDGCERTPTEHVRVVAQVSAVEPRRLQFSPANDNRFLAMEAKGQVGIWDLDATGKPQLFASINAGAINAGFSRDGKFLATVGLDGRVRWWSVDGRLLWVSKGGHSAPARAVAVSSSFIASGGEDGTIRLWTLDGSPLGEPISAHQGSVVSLDISIHGDVASVGEDDAVRLWKRIDSGVTPGPPTFEAKVLYQPGGSPYSDHFIGLTRMDTSWGWDRAIAFSPRGDIVAAALLDDSVRLWNIDGTSRIVMSAPHPQRHVRVVSFSPTGDTFATGGFDGMIRQWNLDGSPHGAPINAHERVVFSAAFTSRGDRLATTGYDNIIRIWKTDGSRLAELPPGHPDRMVTIAFATHEPLLATADDKGGVRLWNFDGTPRGVPLVGHKGLVNALTFSPKDGLIASGGQDQTVRFWNLNGAPRGRAQLAGPRLASVVFSPGGDALAVGTAPFQLFAENKRLWQQEMRSADRVQCISFSPRGDFIVTGSVLGDYQVWNADGSPRIPALKQKWEWITAVAVAPDGDYFAGVDGGSGHPIFGLFNLDGSPRGEPLEGHLGAIASLAFSPSGQLVSGGEDGVVRLWTLPSRQVDTIDLGLSINQLGFWRNVLWVRANGDSVLFFDKSRRLLATTLLRRNSILTFTPDGWVTSSSEPTRFVRVFSEAGEVLPEAQTVRRVSPQKVLDALEKADRW